jgi:hypothetical protein
MFILNYYSGKWFLMIIQNEIRNIKLRIYQLISIS